MTRVAARALLALVLVASGALALPQNAATAVAGAAKTVNLVLLGDSYTAGNGAQDASGDAHEQGPADCHRSDLNWGQQYANQLRTNGYAVAVTNAACSGAVTDDLTSPRKLDDGTVLPPQVEAVSPSTDVVAMTIGGNDIAFSTIVQDCFVLKNPSSCKSDIDAARAGLPAVATRAAKAIAAMRARGLREDATVFYLGYPRLQLDNNYTLFGGYPAGAEIRKLGDEGEAVQQQVVAAADAGHPGQFQFVSVKSAFAGHEPDAGAVGYGTQSWLIPALDVTQPTYRWYHPDPDGQAAYARTLGTFAPTVRSLSLSSLTVRVPKRVSKNKAAKLKVTVHLADGSAPRGRLLLRTRGLHKITTKVRPKRLGEVRVKLPRLGHGKHKLRLVYRGKDGTRLKTVVTVRVRR